MAPRTFRPKCRTFARWLQRSRTARYLDPLTECLTAPEEALSNPCAGSTPAFCGLSPAAYRVAVNIFRDADGSVGTGATCAAEMYPG